MEAYQERVVKEKAELDSKIEKLSDFLGNENPASAEERVNLHVQLGLMEQYSRVLGDRINAFA